MAEWVLFRFVRVGMEWNGTERNTRVCQWVALVIGGITDFDVFGRGLKKGNDVDLFGGLGYSRGFWEKVRIGSN